MVLWFLISCGVVTLYCVLDLSHQVRQISRVSCQKGPICHASAWRVGPFWQDTLDITYWKNKYIWECRPWNVCHFPQVSVCKWYSQYYAGMFINTKNIFQCRGRYRRRHVEALFIFMGKAWKLLPLNLTWLIHVRGIFLLPSVLVT